MSHHNRLKTFAEQVCEAGLAGKSMQDKLAELVRSNDFTAHEIERIAEQANRLAQLGFQKTAKDKRVKFELCDPKPLAKQARKLAFSQFAAPTDAQKVAHLTAQMGDPFKAPVRSDVSSLSLMKQPLDEGLVLTNKLAEIKVAMIELDKHRIEYTATLKQGDFELAKLAASAEERFKAVVQSAMDMVMSGVTVPSLYEAVMAGCEGTRASPEDRENADHLMAMIIEGLKQRGVPNHRMGFRYLHDKRALDALDTQQLVARCRYIYYKQHPPRDLDQRDVAKYAAVTETWPVDIGPIPGNKGPNQNIDEANDFMKTRPTVAAAWDAQAYLDDPDNIPAGGIRVINGQNEFVIGITDMVGTQARVWRARSANEYLGLKLKEIEQLLTELARAKELVAGALEKRAAGQPLPPLLAGGAKELGTVVLSTKNTAQEKKREAPRATQTLSGGESCTDCPDAVLKAAELLKISIAPLAALGAVANIAGAAGAVGSMLPKKPAAPAQPKTGGAIGKAVGFLGHPATGTAVGLAGIGITAKQMMDANKQQKQQPGAQQ